MTEREWAVAVYRSVPPEDPVWTQLPIAVYSVVQLPHESVADLYDRTRRLALAEFGTPVFLHARRVE